MSHDENQQGLGRAPQAAAQEDPIAGKAVIFEHAIHWGDWGLMRLRLLDEGWLEVRDECAKSTYPDMREAMRSPDADFIVACLLAKPWPVNAMEAESDLEMRARGFTYRDDDTLLIVRSDGSVLIDHQDEGAIPYPSLLWAMQDGHSAVIGQCFVNDMRLKGKPQPLRPDTSIEAWSARRVANALERAGFKIQGVGEPDEMTDGSVDLTDKVGVQVGADGLCTVVVENAAGDEWTHGRTWSRLGGLLEDVRKAVAQ